MVHYLGIVESVKRDCVGFLVRENIAGGAFVVIPKLGDGILEFCSICCIEVVDFCWVIRSEERYGMTRIATSLRGTCACLESIIKRIVSDRDRTWRHSIINIHRCPHFRGR